MGSCGASVSNCGLPVERGSAWVSNENAPSVTDGAFCVWLPTVDVFRTLATNRDLLTAIGL